MQSDTSAANGTLHGHVSLSSSCKVIRQDEIQLFHSALVWMSSGKQTQGLIVQNWNVLFSFPLGLKAQHLNATFQMDLLA